MAATRICIMLFMFGHLQMGQVSTAITTISTTTTSAIRLSRDAATETACEHGYQVVTHALLGNLTCFPIPNFTAATSSWYTNLQWILPAEPTGLDGNVPLSWDVGPCGNLWTHLNTQKLVANLTYDELHGSCGWGCVTTDANIAVCSGHTSLSLFSNGAVVSKWMANVTVAFNATASPAMTVDDIEPPVVRPHSSVVEHKGILVVYNASSFVSPLDKDTVFRDGDYVFANLTVNDDLAELITVQWVWMTQHSTCNGPSHHDLTKTLENLGGGVGYALLRVQLMECRQCFLCVKGIPSHPGHLAEEQMTEIYVAALLPIDVAGADSKDADSKEWLTQPTLMLIIIIVLVALLFLTWCLLFVYCTRRARPVSLISVEPATRANSGRELVFHAASSSQSTDDVVFGKAGPGEAWFPIRFLLERSSEAEFMDAIRNLGNEDRVFVRFSHSLLFPRHVSDERYSSPEDYARCFGIELSPHHNHWCCFHPLRVQHFLHYLKVFAKRHQQIFAERPHPLPLKAGIMLVDPSIATHRDLPPDWVAAAAPSIELPSIVDLEAMEALWPTEWGLIVAESRSSSCPPMSSSSHDSL